MGNLFHYLESLKAKFLAKAVDLERLTTKLIPLPLVHETKL